VRHAARAFVVLAALYAAVPHGTVPDVNAQGPRCLHGEDEVPEQRARRLLALTATREVNTTQAVVAAKTGVFQPLLSLPLTQAVPPGFRLQLSNDGVTYAFSVKDTTDPCLFAYFSDQTGIILVGRAIQ
jgi:hypothetical protein